MKSHQQKIGERINDLVCEGYKPSDAASVAMGELSRNSNPKDFNHKFKEKYLDHLEKQGDKYALEMREAILKGEEIGQDPSGT